MMVPETKLGVLVVEGTIERLTGAGKFVVSPIREHTDVAVGNRVMVVILDKLQPEIALQTFKERVTSPFPSNWAIIVTGNRYVERCNVSYNGTQLSALDPAGVPRTELPLPRDGVLNFRIPETVNVENDEIVEVRDGNRMIRYGELRIDPGQADEGIVSRPSPSRVSSLHPTRWTSIQRMSTSRTELLARGSWPLSPMASTRSNCRTANPIRQACSGQQSLETTRVAHRQGR